MSDIRFIYAPIRGGKTLFSVIEICRELARTERFIVTNIPLCLVNPPAGYWTLQEYCQEFIKKPVDVRKRVACLTQTQTLEHWRYLPAEGLTAELIEKFRLEIVENEFDHVKCRVAKLPLKSDPVHKEVTDFAARDRRNGCFMEGVHYFIDEVHTLYSARNYRQVSADAENYQSQLGHLNDDQSLISQHPEKVDRNFRRNATEWLRVRNLSKQPLFMGVTFNKRFRYHHYIQNEMPQKGDAPDNSGWYYLDGKKRFHQLYFTMGGGVSGGLVCEENRFKGKHWSVWVAAALVFFAAVYFLPKVLQATITAGVRGVSGGVQAGIQNGLNKAGVTNLSPVVPFSAPAGALPLPAPDHGLLASVGVNSARPGGFSTRAVTPPAPILAKGYSAVGTNVWVFLTDGTVCKSEFGEVLGVGAAAVNLRDYGVVRVMH